MGEIRSSTARRVHELPERGRASRPPSSRERPERGRAVPLRVRAIPASPERTPGALLQRKGGPQTAVPERATTTFIGPMSHSKSSKESQAAWLECVAVEALEKLSHAQLKHIVNEHIDLEFNYPYKNSKVYALAWSCAAAAGQSQQHRLSAVLTAVRCMRRVPHAQQRHCQGDQDRAGVGQAPGGGGRARACRHGEEGEGHGEEIHYGEDGEGGAARRHLHGAPGVGRFLSAVRQ